ncbi:MAG TPA: hypothetical protein DD713_03355 [Nitrospiraceae bacterium]|nr:hypothetical protein [Nitrospiraceae bacterium]
MGRFPQITSERLARFLKSQGFIEDRQSGSHLTLYHKEKKVLVTIPVHTGCDIGRGLAVKRFKRMPVSRLMIICG